ncbi:Ig domain-containing protein [Tautonia marina]|uniref:Ig domain-containing protein n=1 Tax=Tautonia marina TaxID=2653855 RepID=UPI001260FF06|nr:Ig domain-containing protein [Tautonia marina]
MRRGRRGGHGVLEFGGSGEDSFVAVVVTKLTGALLFILLLSMVIMALIPRAVDSTGATAGSSGKEPEPLAIVTPERLPEAIVGRPYELALAATGGSGTLRWMIDGPIPEGLTFDPEQGLIRGTPESGTPGPVSVRVRVTDGRRSDGRALSMVVYQPDGPLSLPTPLEATLGLPRLPWRAWGELGFGFLVLALVHLVAMNGVAAMQRQALARAPEGSGSGRFAWYRGIIRLATVSAVVALAGWLWMHRGMAEDRPNPQATMAVATAPDDRPQVSR